MIEMPPEASQRTVNRRQVLKTTGVAAVGATGLAGIAAGHEESEVTEGPVFCGCSQVCACGDGEAEVIVASEDSDGEFTCTRVTQDFDFCYEVDDDKIIAVEVDGTVFCNPNTACAGNAIEDCDIDCDETGEQGGPCGQPPCEHPGRR